MTVGLTVIAGDGAALSVVPRETGDFTCDKLTLTDPQTFVARFNSPGGDRIEVVVTPKSTTGPAFQRLSHTVVRYRGNVASPTEARRAAVASLVLGVGHAINARVAAAPEGSTIADALGRSRGTGYVRFSREALRDLLAPDIVDGTPVAGGWTLVDVYPTSHVRESKGSALELVLDFQRERDGRRLLFVVAQRNPAKRAFAESAHLALSYLSLGAQEPEGTQTLQALVAFVLQLRDHEGLEFEFTDVLEDLETALLPAPSTPPAPVESALNLAINSECNQSCAFCSVKDTSPAEDGGDATFVRLVNDMTAARARGVHKLRVNGYDPLTYSRIGEVISTATRLGFDEVDVFSPATALADETFCDTVLAALPPAHTFHVPLYAADAHVHDRVVGRPGAFDLVSRALANLLARTGREHIAVLSVVVRENLHALPELVRWCRSNGLRFSAHTPYPSLESRADRFYASVPAQHDVVEALARLYTDGTAHTDERIAFPVTGIAPCVVLRGMRAHGVDVRRWIDPPERAVMLPGTEYRDAKFNHGAGHRDDGAFVASSVPCPHAAVCSLREPCGGELLRGYVEMYGADEFRAVGVAELLDLPRPER